MAALSGGWVRLGLLVVIVVGFGLRTWGLGDQELRGDEAFGYFFSLRPYPEIIEATFELKEPHPVASYFVQKAWLDWSGHSEYALRFTSLWFGVLTIALLSRLGRRLDLPPLARLVAAGLLSLSPYAVWHSQDARMYSQSLALTIASTWLAVEWLQRQRWPWAAAYLLVSWLALHTHYFNAFVLLAQTLFVVSRALIVRRLWNTLSAWLSLQVMLALLFLPWLLPASDLLTAYRGNGDSPGFVLMLERSLSVFAVGESIPAAQRLRWAGLALLLLLGGVLRLGLSGPSGRRTLWLLAFYLMTPLLATWYSAQQRPIFNERYLVAAAPPFFLLIGVALARPSYASSGLNRRLANGNLLLAWLLLIVLLGGATMSLVRHYVDPLYSKTRGWRELARTIDRLAASLPADQVQIAQNFPDPTLWYYYRGPVVHLVLPPAPYDLAGAADSVSQLAAAGVERVILPSQPAPNWDDQGLAATALAERYSLAATVQVGNWPVQLYVMPPQSISPLTVDFQNDVRLAGFALPPNPVVAGGYLVVYLLWRGDGTQLSGGEKVFVQLLNEAGQLVAQDDRPLALSSSGVTTPSLYALPLADSVPAGRYQLITGLYDPTHAGAPRVLTLAEADHVVIGGPLLVTARAQ